MKESYKPGSLSRVPPASKTVIKASEREIRQMVMGAVLGRPVIHNWSHSWTLKPLHGKDVDKPILVAQAIY